MVQLFLHSLKVLRLVCAGLRQLHPSAGEDLPRISVWAAGESPSREPRGTAWAMGLAAGWSNGAAVWGGVPQSSHHRQDRWWVQKWKSTGSPHQVAAQPCDKSCVQSQGLGAWFPPWGSGCSFALPPPAEPSGPTPCTAAATCAGSPAGSRRGTRSQALPAVPGPPTWKASCCSPPLPRSSSAKVRGAHTIHLSVRPLLRQGIRREGEPGCCLPRTRQSDAP